MTTTTPPVKPPAMTDPLPGSATSAGSSGPEDWDLSEHLDYLTDAEAPADPESPLTYRVSQVNESGKSVKSDGSSRLFRGVDLEPSRPIRWIARGHLPAGQVVTLVGDEGIGKSLWWVLVVAHLTTGQPSTDLGIGRQSPKDVVLILTEDGWADTVRPRLEVAGADLNRVHVIASESDGSGYFDLTADLWLIHSAADRLGDDLALVVVDAWLDTVPGRFSVKDPQQARQALHPWRQTANTTGCCVLLVAHSNRDENAGLRSRIGATGALRQKVRMLLYAARPPELDGHLYVGPDKSNGSTRGDALAYRIRPVEARPATDDDDGVVPRLVIEGTTGAPMEAHDARWRADRRRQEHPNRSEQALDWLTGYLDQRGGHAPAIDVQTEAKRAGHNFRAMASLLKENGGDVRNAGPGTPWTYYLTKGDTDSD